MIVVSDTSPITALLAVGSENLLRELFTEVVIPDAVQKELLRTHVQLPEWLEVVSLKSRLQADGFANIVDVGEAEAIALAGELHADLLLIDERKGRKLAAQQCVPVIGLVGVVLLAKRKALIPSAKTLLQRLDREGGMYLSETIRVAALKTVGE